MKKIALAAALSVAATTAFAGGAVEPTMAEEPMVDTAKASSGGMMIPLLLLLLVLAAASQND